MNENLMTAGSVLIFITISVTLTAYGLIQIWAGYLGINDPWSACVGVKNP
jgi:hypothetical protein